MSLSDLNDQELLILNDVLLGLRDAYDRMITGISVAKELTKENFQDAFEGLGIFGKRMMEFEEDLRKIHSVRQDIDVLIRSSQIKAKLNANVDKEVKKKYKTVKKKRNEQKDNV